MRKEDDVVVGVGVTLVEEPPGGKSIFVSGHGVVPPGERNNYRVLGFGCLELERGSVSLI